MRPDEARSIENAYVFKGDTLAATLRRTRDGVVFAYESTYVGRPVASTLPVRDTPLLTPAGGLPPFFAGLLPEGARLEAVIRAVKTSADDELSLLLAVGVDTIGDVVVVPEGDDPADRSTPSTDPSTVSFRELFARSIDPTGGALDAAVPGIQDKLSHAVISLPLTAASGPALLKLSPTGYPRLVENEAFFLRMAKDCGLVVPPFEVVADRDGDTGLLVQRFDRVANAEGTLTKLQQEDACQVAGRWPADKYRLSMREVIEAMSMVASSPPVATLNLVLQTAFAALIANGDLHAKNMSLRWLPDDELVEVTPIYDVVSTRPYPLDHRLALAVDGRNNRIRGRDLAVFAVGHGVPERLLLRRLNGLLDRAEPLIPTAGSIGFDDRTTTLLIDEMHTRLARLRA
jgi:serine/threonine-protein kinase HipA